METIDDETSGACVDYITAILESSKEFPPRHEPASFTIDHAVKAVQKFLAKD
jgi:arylsulfatase